MRLVVVGFVVLVLSVLAAGCGDDDGRSTPRADETSSSASPKDVATDMADGWCETRIGMTRSEVIDLMGEPSQENGDGEFLWTERDVTFRLIFNADDTVNETDVFYSDLNESGRSLIGCIDENAEDGWTQGWCDVKSGMTREQVYAVMGHPTGENEKNSNWGGYDGYSFTVFFDRPDERGKSQTAQNDGWEELDAEAQASMPCDQREGGLH